MRPNFLLWRGNVWTSSLPSVIFESKKQREFQFLVVFGEDFLTWTHLILINKMYLFFFFSPSCWIMLLFCWEGSFQLVRPYECLKHYIKTVSIFSCCTSSNQYGVILSFSRMAITAAGGMPFSVWMIQAMPGHLQNASHPLGTSLFTAVLSLSY